MFSAQDKPKTNNVSMVCFHLKSWVVGVRVGSSPKLLLAAKFGFLGSTEILFSASSSWGLPHFLTCGSAYNGATNPSSAAKFLNFTSQPVVKNCYQRAHVTRSGPPRVKHSSPKVNSAVWCTLTRDCNQRDSSPGDTLQPVYVTGWVFQ